MKKHMRQLAVVFVGSFMAAAALAQSVNNFNSQPPAADWTTYSRAGGAADAYEPDADVNANLSTNVVNAQLAPDAANPPAKAANALWSSTGQYLQTRPTGNRYTTLMGKFVNNTGTNATQVTISYLFTIAGGGVAEDSGKGMRVYFSLTGAANSWTNLVAMNSTASANGSSTVSTNLPLVWSNGASLYLLWADDNANAMGDDSANQIDDFSLQVTAGTPLAFSCALSAPTNNALLASGSLITAAASATSGIEPYTIEYFTNSGAGNTLFASAGTNGTAPYHVNLGALPAGTYNIYAVATDSATNPATAITATNTFQVADPLVGTLTTPANGATFDSAVSVSGTATVAGGTPPYAVRFYLDEAAVGSPVTNAPYTHDFGTLFVGNHAIQAVATDSRGWINTSAVHTITVTGPLAVILSPTNGTSYNYGRTLVLEASLGGGTTPYTATFFTNGQPAGTLTAPPFMLDLGILPVGDYACHVRVTDSSPTTQQIFSTTNIISVVANPLTVTLTAPTAGQQVATTTVFSAAATVAVGAPVTVSSVEFFLDGISLGADTTLPYSLVVSNRVLGSHSVYAVATDSLGRQSFTATNAMNFIVDPLANNNFVNRIPLTLPARVTGANAGANTESGEPTGSGFTRWGATLWWTWTAPTNGPVQVNTYGSSFNTLLAVYTGSAVNGLTQVAMNDNAPGVSSGPSLVTFTAVPGTVYQIVVGGIQGFGGGGTIATGTIQLALSMPPTVSLTSPTNNAFFRAGSAIQLSATATAALGTVTTVEFFRAGTNIATVTEAPYTFAYADAPLGSNTFFAVVTDSAGQTATSAVARVLVADLGVTLTSPADGATYTSTGSITVSAFPLLSSGSMTGIEFFADDTRFGVDTNSPYSATWTNVTAGVHQLTAVGTDDAGLQYTSAPVLIAVARTLMPTGSVWKYHDAGVDLGTAWVAPEFDDSSWTNGPSELGYGDGDEATVINSGPADNFYLTAYFRRSILLTNVAAYAQYILSVKRDDGAVVYVNGKEVARFNMNSGTVTFSTLAPNASDDGANFFTASVAATNFVEGTNVIAVEVHQSGPTSSDLSFNLALLGMPIIPRNALPLAALTSPINHRTELAPASLTLTAEASDKDGTVTNLEFYANGVKLGETTNLPASLVWSNVPAGVYQLLAVAVDDLGGRGASPVMTVSVHDLGAPSWMAFNDHAAGPGTHANATLYDAFGRNGAAMRGPLRDVATGAWLPAQLSLATYHALPGTQSAAPTAGTPAHAVFSGYVDFGASMGQPAIQILGDGYVTHTFSGLNPQRRYQLRASVIGGAATAYNSWTRFALLNSAALVPAHTTNVIVGQGQLGGLGLNEAAMNTGNNLTGEVVGWDMVVPNADGTLVLKSSRYLGPAPGNNQPAQVALAPVAIRLEEIGPVPITWITAPREGFTVEGPTNVTITAEAYGFDGIAQVEFFGNGVSLGSAAANPYSLVWINGPFGGNTLTAVASGTSGGRATSAPVNIIITIPPTNLIPPTVAAKVPTAGATVGSLTTIQVTFSERVIGVDARDLLVNEVPATNVTGSGSNYVFSVAQPLYGTVEIRWADDHGITDIGWPQYLAFYENSGGARWSFTLTDLTAPTVASKSPAAGSALTNLTEVTVTFSEDVTGVNASDLLVNGTPAYDVSGAGRSYTFDLSQPASGTVNLTWASNHGITDLAEARNAFNRTGAGATWSYTLDAKTVIFQTNSLWQFVKGTNEASRPTNAWRQLAFDDSGGSNAPAPFFYGDPYSNGVPAYTLLSDMRSNYSSIYLRKPFVVHNAAVVTNLYLRAIMDDGMVVWINGVEVLRYNVPAGELGYDGAASSAAFEQNGLGYTNFTLLNPTNYLVSGTNLIAIHALNESLSSSTDFGFNAQLYTYLPNTEAVAPRIAASAPAAGYVYGLTNITVTFSEPVTNVEAADLLVNGTPAGSLSSLSNAVFSFGFPQPPFGAVAITWASNHGIVDLDVEPKPFSEILANSTWGYNLLNPNAPHVLAVDPAGTTVNSLAQIMFSFSEPVTGLEAADLLINGTPAAGLSGGGSNFTFTFPQPSYGTVSVDWATNHGIRDLEVPANEFDPSWPGHRLTYTLVDQTPPLLLGQMPAAGAAVTNLTEITVTFSESVAGVTAGDLLINGKAARSVTGSNASFTFSFGQVNGSVIQVAWAANHGIKDLATVANAFDATVPGTSWSYSTVDTVPPATSLVSPPPFVAVRSLKQIKVTFDEPVTGVDAADLLINSVPVQQLSGSAAGPYTFAFTPPATGLVQVAWAANHGIRDQAGIAFAGGAWTQTLNPGLATEFAVAHVIHISVDGLGGYYLGDYVTNQPAVFPNFRRLFTEGAATINARVDYTASETIPNHSSQLTGRPVEQPAGWANTTHHGITFNSDNGQTIHISGNPLVPYKSSPFDVVHDNGLSTAFLYSKQSLTILARSWTSGGGVDLVGADNGSNKIDFLHSSVNSGNYGPSSALVDDLIPRIQTNGLWNYTFMHWTEPDQYGHQSGWGGTAYSNQVLQLDAQLGRILDALQANPALASQTVIILTADHGGTGTGHFEETVPIIYSLPFCLWGAGIPAGVDTYSLFSNRADPGTTRPTYSDTAIIQPLHNADVANLAVTLLGLPNIPGAPLIPVLGGKPVKMLAARSPLGIQIAWPVTADDIVLQATPVLGPAATWQIITNGISLQGDAKVFSIIPGPGQPPQFFRLIKP